MEIKPSGIGSVAGGCCVGVTDRACCVWLREDYPSVETIYMELSLVASFATLVNI